MVKFGILKLREGILIPTKATSGSSGYDIYSPEERIINSKETILIKTGFSLEIPNGWEAQIRTRSGLSLKHGIIVLNSPGTIDSDYKGEVGVILYKSPRSYYIDRYLCPSYKIKKGERIAQLVFVQVPEVALEEVDSLSETNRGSGGFGSTGKF